MVEDADVNDATNDKLAARWARFGVLFNVAPVRGPTPDLERLLTDTARAAPSDPRLFVLAVTWLSAYGIYVAAHRLKHLASQLEPEHQATLGVLLDTAVEHGAPKSLRQVVASALSKAADPGPLFVTDQGPLASLVEPEATPASKRWGRWVQPVETKPDALRPPAWVLRRNPEFAGRAAHKGDLRTSIVHTLRRDLGGGPVSEAQLARSCGATPIAVRAALDDLRHELPNLDVERRRGRGGSCIVLRSA